MASLPEVLPNMNVSTFTGPNEGLFFTHAIQNHLINHIIFNAPIMNNLAEKNGIVVLDYGLIYHL